MDNNRAGDIYRQMQQRRSAEQAQQLRLTLSTMAALTEKAPHLTASIDETTWAITIQDRTTGEAVTVMGTTGSWNVASERAGYWRRGGVAAAINWLNRQAMAQAKAERGRKV